MKPGKDGGFLSLALLAALILWLFLGRAKPSQERRETRKSQTKPARAAPGRRRSTVRRLALGLGTLLVVLAATGGTLALIAAAGNPASESAAASQGDGAEGSSGATATPERLASPSPAVTPISPSPNSTNTPTLVTAGGDQPIGPQAVPTQGEIPENVGPSAEFLALRDALAGQIETYRTLAGDIEVAIAVTDLQTNQTISINGNIAQRTGCTINMFALFAAVDEFQSGRASPSTVASNIAIGIGHSYPPQVKQLLDTLFGSHWTGVAQAGEMMRSWGMEASLFDHVPYYGDGSQNNLLTALETTAVLSKLYRGELFEPEWTAYTLSRLREIKPGLNYMLPGRLPAAATVAHKIGYYWDRDGWVNNDAGIVTFTGADGEEKAYAITYLSQRALTEATGYSFAAWLSGIVWDWFDATYRLETEPSAPPPPPPPPPPTPRPTPLPALSPTPAHEPSSTLTPSPAPQPSATPSPTSEPNATPSPTAAPSPTPSPAPQPSATPTPAVTPSPGPEPTPTTLPTPSPAPSPDPER
ncbi:MAG: serine hydrolase [Dehalococcoidia bacterium]